MGCGNSFCRCAGRRGPPWERPRADYSPGRAEKCKERAPPGRVSHLLRRATRKLVCARSLRLRYAELHARSAFSFLEGASTPEELAGVCAGRGVAAMGLLDGDGGEG